MFSQILTNKFIIIYRFLLVLKPNTKKYKKLRNNSIRNTYGHKLWKISQNIFPSKTSLCNSLLSLYWQRQFNIMARSMAQFCNIISGTIEATMFLALGFRKILISFLTLFDFGQSRWYRINRWVRKIWWWRSSEKHFLQVIKRFTANRTRENFV